LGGRDSIRKRVRTAAGQGVEERDFSFPRRGGNKQRGLPLVKGREKRSNPHPSLGGKPIYMLERGRGLPVGKTEVKEKRYTGNRHRSSTGQRPLSSILSS